MCFPEEEGIVQVETFGVHCEADGTVICGLGLEVSIPSPSLPSFFQNSFSRTGIVLTFSPKGCDGSQQGSCFFGSPGSRSGGHPSGFLPDPGLCDFELSARSAADDVPRRCVVPRQVLPVPLFLCFPYPDQSPCRFTAIIAEAITPKMPAAKYMDKEVKPPVPIVPRLTPLIQSGKRKRAEASARRHALGSRSLTE